MDNFTSVFFAVVLGVTLLVPNTPRREPMSYDSIEDYTFWRLQMYDHF